MLLVRAENINLILERNLRRTMMEYCMGSWTWKTLLQFHLNKMGETCVKMFGLVEMQTLEE